MTTSSSFEPSKFFKKAIFFTLLIGIFSLYHLFTFKGLTSSTGIDQAQVAREVARGNRLTTQFIRPIAIQQTLENKKPLHLEHFPETYHAPLNILVYAGVLKLVGADDPENYKMDINDTVYMVDTFIAITCALFFLLAIGINYALIAKIFDAKIAGTVAVIMLLSDFLWKLSQTGLPQMLMLTLFSAAMYLAWRAVEAQEAEKKPLLPALCSGFFFALLALTHWITLWIFIGYVFFAIFYFKPRGVIALSLIGIMVLFLAGPLIYYQAQSGSPLGTAFHAIHGGSGNGEIQSLRGLENKGLNMKGFILQIAHTTLIQISSISKYLGGLLLAPAFFLSLAYPFQRSSISVFRWNIMVMWVFASMGMAIYGVSENVANPNQLHILFAPLMTGYGIAMLCIIWARCPLSQSPGFIRDLHLFVVIAIAAAPLLLYIRQVTRPQPPNASVNGIYANSLNGALNSFTDKDDMICSDQPWAVAWYADRHAIWTPRTIQDLEAIEAIAEPTSPVQGLHFSSLSYRGKDIRSTWLENRDLTPLTYASWIRWFTRTNNNQNMFPNNPAISELVGSQKGRYKYGIQLSALLDPSIYYSRDVPRKQ